MTARLEVKHNLPRPKVRMVNPLASRGLSGLLVVVAGAVASAITCPIYVFKDPDVVEEPEATNLVTEIRRFAESVILLHSTSDLVNCLLNGTLNGSQLVVPKDQQLNSLEMALHAQNQSSELLLQHMVHGELHIVFHHSQYFAWTHCSSSGARNLSGGGFGQGPSRLPNVTLVACIPTSSLPTVVDGVYGTSGIFAWTAPQGEGRMTYMGADYFEVLPEWPQLLESSLASRCLEGNASTGTGTTTVTTTMPTTSRPNMVHTGCPVYMLNDPWIVDASQEGTNLLTEIRSFADSVIVLDSTSDLVALLGNGTLAGGQLVVPEQEWGSLSSALGSQSRSLLAQHIEAGLHLVVHSSVELIMQITGWSLWTTSCSAGSSAPQGLRGGGFGQGPGSLPNANLVACVPRSSSPSSMDGAYGTMHMLYAWTAPYGSGRITYMGADYFEVRPEWPELLESSLGARCYSGNTTTVTRTTVVTTTLTTATVTTTTSLPVITVSCPVYMLNDPWIVDASQEGTNLLTEIRSFADSVIVLDSTSDLVALLGNGTLVGGQLVVPEQEWGSLSSALGSQSRSLLAQHIEAGLHLVVHSSVDLIMQITGWSLWTTSCSGSAPQDLWGGGFGQGPGSLPNANLVTCVQRSSLPSSTDGVYGTSMVYAWTAPYGSGRITYMGADYFEVRPEWPELLESSLGARCYSGNTTTVTRTTVVTTTLTTATVTVTSLPVECGSVLHGSNVGQPNTIGSAAGDVWHMFCPTAAGTVEISTCGSDYDTFLYIQGSNIDYSCDDCGSCGTRTETTVTNFLPGECYNIIVGGFSSREGNYVLSISCEALTTTPPL